MSDSKRRSGLIQPGSAIAHMVGQAQQSIADEEAKAAGRTGQGKPGNTGQVGVDKRGTSKATYNLPLDALALIDLMATEYDVPKNDIIQAAIVLLFNAQAADPDLLRNIRVPARLLTTGFRLSVPADFYFSSEASQP